MPGRLRADAPGVATNRLRPAEPGMAFQAVRVIWAEPRSAFPLRSAQRVPV